MLNESKLMLRFCDMMPAEIIGGGDLDANPVNRVYTICNSDSSISLSRTLRLEWHLALHFLDQDHKLQETGHEMLSFDANMVHQVVVRIARS